jgi:hypothetical protein
LGDRHSTSSQPRQALDSQSPIGNQRRSTLTPPLNGESCSSARTGSTSPARS